MGVRLSRLAAVMLLGASSAMAEAVPPPQPPGEQVMTTPSSSKDLVRSLQLGSYTARFEKTRLDEIRDRIGSGQAAQAGDASTSMRWYCYSLPGQLVWLVSGEMGGGERLTHVAAQAIGISDPRRLSCPEIPSSLRPVRLDAGWIGNSRSAIEHALGKPTAVQGDWLVYQYGGKERGPYKGPGDTQPREVEFDVSSEVTVRIHEGTVVELYASHVTSY